MLPVDQILTDETGNNKASKVFNAQWYPQVTVILDYTNGVTANIKLEGSLDGVNWVDVVEAADNPITITSDHWYHYYRLWIAANDRTINAKIGASGA